jgi:hypothetical protein
MNSFETSATVEEEGRVFIAGVPFAPGTEVEIRISPKAPLAGEETPEDDKALAAARARMRELFAQVRGRNTESIGPLRREELYDRKVLR